MVVAPLHHGYSLPQVKLAVIAETDLTGRRRTHRQPRARNAPGEHSHGGHAHELEDLELTVDDLTPQV